MTGAAAAGSSTGFFRTKCRGTTPRGAQQLLQAGAWPQLPAPRAPEAGVRAGGEALPFAAGGLEESTVRWVGVGWSWGGHRLRGTEILLESRPSCPSSCPGGRGVSCWSRTRVGCPCQIHCWELSALSCSPSQVSPHPKELTSAPIFPYTISLPLTRCPLFPGVEGDALSR